MKNIFKSLLVLLLVGTPLTVHATVTPSDWTGSVVVTGDGAGGVDVVPVGLAPLTGLQLQAGAIVDQANDLTIDGNVQIGADGTLSTYNVTAGILTANGADLKVAYGAANQGTISQTGGTVYVDQNIVVGFGDGAVGTYVISGADSLCEVGWTILGEGAGSNGNLIIENGATYRAKVTNGWEAGPVTVGFNNGTGNLAINTGGTLETRELRVGQAGLWGGPAGYGTATLAEGNIFITHGNLHIGKERGSTGQFIQTGGTVDLVTYSDGTWQKDLVIGYDATGVYDMQGGSFIGDWAILGEADGTGTLNISGNAEFTTNKVTIGLGTGTGALTLNGGILNTEILELGNAGTFDFVDGILSADAVNNLAVVQEGGIVSPGDSPGVSAFGAGYTMQEAGTYLVEINGLIQGTDYDWVDVTGAALLDGTVAIDLLDGFTPTATDYFDVLTASEGITLGATFTLDGGTSELPEGWNWTYSLVDLGDAGQTLRIQAVSSVPEPSMIALLVGLIVGIQAFRRH